MNSILLVCDRANIDRPLRRSIAHLANTCQIETVPDGYVAFKELSDRAFNLVVIDFALAGIDGLELTESLSYIDPDVPVVLMLDQNHRAMWGEARSLGASPILRPFKPLTFLRLVDTLLHQHLERFRELADVMQSILHALAAAPGATCALWLDGDGQALFATPGLQSDQLHMLATLAASRINSEPQPAQYPPDTDHQLAVATVLDHLFLAVLVETRHNGIAVDDLWPQIDDSVEALRQRVFQLTAVPASNQPPGRKIAVPVRLNSQPVTLPPPATDDTPEPDEVSVNWAILTNNADTLTRLKNILSQ